MKNMTLFEAVGGVKDHIIEESLELFDGTAIPYLPRRQNPLVRFLGSNWGVAVICAVVSLGVLGGIIWAGHHAPDPVPPADTTQQTEILTEQTEQTTPNTTLDTEPPTELPTEAITTAPKPALDVWDGSIAKSILAGTGSQSDPYIIQSGAELAFVAKQVNANVSKYKSAYYELRVDIDLSGKPWTPIGLFSTAHFSGKFDGKGYSIKNLNVTAAPIGDDKVAVAGLFGLASDCTIQNIDLVSPKVQINLDNKADYAYIGTLIGCYQTPAKDTLVNIRNCRVTNATVTVQKAGSLSVGGMIGYVRAYDGDDITLKNLESHATIKISNVSQSNTGGIVGLLNCHMSGRVTMENFCGYTKVSTTRDGTQYIGTIGGIAAPDGRVTLKNGYGKVEVTGELTTSNNYKNDGYAMVGMIYSGAAEKRYYFSNLFGKLTASNKTVNELYFCYYPIEEGVDHASPYPKDGVLNQDIWDLSNIREPKLRWGELW